MSELNFNNKKLNYVLANLIFYYFVRDECYVGVSTHLPHITLYEQKRENWIMKGVIPTMVFPNAFYYSSDNRVDGKIRIFRKTA